MNTFQVNMNLNIKVLKRSNGIVIIEIDENLLN